MNKRISKADLTTLAAGICQELGQGWAVKPCDLEHLVKFVHDDGHGLAIHATWDGPGRLSISGEYPRDAKSNTCYGRSVIRYNGSLPKITVADTKTAKQIAGDIKRRLLPEYLEIYKKAVERKASADKYEAAQGSVLDRLARIAPSLHVDRERKVFSDYRSEGGYVTNGQASDDSVSMDLRSVPVEKAEAILRLLHA